MFKTSNDAKSFIVGVIRSGLAAENLELHPKNIDAIATAINHAFQLKGPPIQEVRLMTIGSEMELFEWIDTLPDPSPVKQLMRDTYNLMSRWVGQHVPNGASPHDATTGVSKAAGLVCALVYSAAFDPGEDTKQHIHSEASQASVEFFNRMVEGREWVAKQRRSSK